MSARRDRNLVHWWTVVRLLTPMLLSWAVVVLTGIQKDVEKIEPLLVKVATLEVRVNNVESAVGLDKTRGKNYEQPTERR